MIRFDKIKLVSKVDYIKVEDTNKFISEVKNGCILSYKYIQKAPFILIIIINYERQELIIEFTGKILLDRYNELINIETIELCLNNINKLGFCNIEIEKVLHDSQVVKCDVTKDIYIDIDIKDITEQIKTMICNYDKWKCTKYLGGVCLNNSVKTSRYKNRIIIYDKYKEMEMKDNQDFLNVIPNGKDMLDSFKNVKRFELNINTMKQIRMLLKITNNDLLNVLNSKENPILKVLDKAIIKDIPTVYKRMRFIDVMRVVFLEKYKYDLEKIEVLLRRYSAKTTSIRNAMQPFIRLKKNQEEKRCISIDFRSLVT